MVRVTPFRLVLAVAFIGSTAFIAFAVLKVRDTSQIPMLSSGFLILGVAFAALAIGALVRIFSAASRAQLGRAVGLAVGGGLCGLAAIGCFTATVVLALLWKSS